MHKKTSLPQILSTQEVARGRFFALEQVHLQFSNGVKRIYERMKGQGSGSVMIVPVINDHQIYLVKEYAVGTERYELTFPKGLVDANESALTAANRELQEELGFAANKLIPLKSLALMPGFSASMMNVYIACDLYPSQLEGDEPEPIEAVMFDLNDPASLLNHPHFADARSIAAFFLAQRFLRTATTME